MCQAGKSDGTCFAYDFSMTAAWRGTTRTMATFWQEAFERRAQPSPIWQIPGFLVSYCAPDFMHVSCLGILQYLSGNVLFEVFQHLGGTRDNHVRVCGVIRNMARQSAKALNMAQPLSKLTIGMICSGFTDRKAKGQKPKMRLKAAQGRYFLKVLHHMLQRLLPLTSDHEILRFNCVDALFKVYRELDEWKDDGSSTHNVATLGRHHLLLYFELNRNSADETKWHLYPKHHLFAHVVSRCSVNPKLEWNYLDENEMGIATSAAAVSNQSTMHTTLLNRYCVTFKPMF